MEFASRRRLLLAACLLLSIAGCASVPQTLQLTREPGNLPRRVSLDEVGFFPQVKYQCGPAALATVLDHAGVEVVPGELIDKVYIPERRGSLQIEMIATARSYGKLVYPLDKQLKALLGELAAGNPVLVFQNLSLSLWPQWHYAVAVGYDLDSTELILRSGTYREHRLSLATFERTWQRAGHWAYLVMNPGELPVSANPDDHLLAAYDLERAGFDAPALKAYRAAASRWPDHKAGLMALGNAEYASGDMSEAQSVFRRVTLGYPEDGFAWNNLAYALAGSGCQRAARDAVACASRLAPDDANIRHSLIEISAMGTGNDESCPILSCPVDSAD